MGRVLEGISPEKVFYYFEEICSIPHGSLNVEEISRYLVDFAKKRKLDVIQDEQKNVLIKKPASLGYENAPTVILQGHMDMVCEKNADTEHDFLKDGLKLKLDGDMLYAEGTTLGGDDGIAVAYALAILDDDTVEHPDLEALFTTDEEVGMEGAFAFDVSKLKGKYFINIDSEEEGCVLTSCAGGVNLDACYNLLYDEAPKDGYKCYEIFIHGLKGGHSGADIHYGRANANILMAQLLYVFYSTGVQYYLADIEGGMKNNAIPREAKAYVFLKDEQKDAIQIVVNDFTARVAQEFAGREDAIKVDFNAAEKKFSRVICGFVKDSFIDSVAHTADGVCRMSKAVPDMVETSSNLGVVSIKEDKLNLSFLIRSSEDTELDKASDVISYVIMQGACNYRDKYAKATVDYCMPEVKLSNRYPGWAYKEDSALRKLLMDVYEKQYNSPMKAEGIHAGLECGIFSGKGNFDIISIGPDILDIHTPKETLVISSARRTYELLCGLLKRATELT